MYLDGNDVTVPVVTAAHSYPNDLLTGYAVGNNPAAAFGDFRFGYSADDILDEVVLYDYALSAARIDRHFVAAIVLASPLSHSGQLVIRLLDEADWPADYDVDTGESVLQFLTSAGSVTANLQKVEDSEQGALFVDEAGDVIFHDRHALLRSPYNTSQVTLEQGVGTLAYEPPVVWGNDDAELFNLAAGARRSWTCWPTGCRSTPSRCPPCARCASTPPPCPLSTPMCSASACDRGSPSRWHPQAAGRCSARRATSSASPTRSTTRATGGRPGTSRPPTPPATGPWTTHPVGSWIVETDWRCRGCALVGTWLLRKSRDF
jgi:hypothetical protein